MLCSDEFKKRGAIFRSILPIKKFISAYNKNFTSSGNKIISDF